MEIFTAFTGHGGAHREQNTYLINITPLFFSYILKTQIMSPINGKIVAYTFEQKASLILSCRILLSGWNSLGTPGEKQGGAGEVE